MKFTSLLTAAVSVAEASCLQCVYYTFLFSVSPCCAVMVERLVVVNIMNLLMDHNLLLLLALVYTTGTLENGFFKLNSIKCRSHYHANYFKC